jgi:glycogen phosphorylase
MVQFADTELVRRRIVFLPDYDMALARYLVQGCDVWLNNPLRPLEACGTSGMKVALNGGLNVSVRDGWWDEWYDGGNGWEIPTADGVADPGRRDELEASALYELLAKSVAPLFYEAGADGVPHGWVDMMRHELRTLGPLVRADRMVGDYVTSLYGPAAQSSRALAADGNEAARALAAWKARVRQAWPSVRVMHVEANGVEPSLGAVLDVRVVAALGDLSPSDVSVEVVYGRPGDDDELVDPSAVTLTADTASPPDAAPGAPGATEAPAALGGPGAPGQPVRFSGSVELAQPGPLGYTVRILPAHPLLASRAELGLVTYPEGPAGMSTGDLR